MVERRRMYEEVLDQWNSTVYPMAEQFILPSRSYADLVVDGQKPAMDSAAKVASLLVSKRSGVEAPT